MNRLVPLIVAIAAVAAPTTVSAQYGYGGHRGGVVRCESNDNRTRVCRVDTRGGVRLVDQDSRAPCVRGRSWGYDRNGIWVSRGCRGKFEVGSAVAYGNRYPSNYRSSNRYPARTSSYYGDRYDPRYGGAYADPRSRDSNPIAAVLGAVLGVGSYDQRHYSGRQPQAFRCESIDGQPRFCRLPFAANRIDIRRQLSDTRCREGYNWGAQRDGVWVERGCRAEFVVY